MIEGLMKAPPFILDGPINHLIIISTKDCRRRTSYILSSPIRAFRVSYKDTPIPPSSLVLPSTITLGRHFMEYSIAWTRQFLPRLDAFSRVRDCRYIIFHSMIQSSFFEVVGLPHPRPLTGLLISRSTQTPKLPHNSRYSPPRIPKDVPPSQV